MSPLPTRECHLTADIVYRRFRSSCFSHLIRPFSAMGVGELVRRIEADRDDAIGESPPLCNNFEDMVQSIVSHIAVKTNLLALNATIEAARAGEAGKGFAVVAAEVKDLPQQSTAATEDIRERVEEIRSSTEKTVHTINNSGAVIAEVSEHSRTIARAIENQDTMISEVPRNMQASVNNSEEVAATISETASASQEITRNVACVDEESKRTAEGASHALDAGNRVQHLADRLQELVSQFNY